MKILVNTDKHVDADANLLQQVEQEVTTTLARFSDQLTRVEVHLSDQNADRGGSTDMRCVIEARAAGKQPMAVTQSAATVEEACSGAVKKMLSLLDSRFGRSEARRGRDSIRDAE